MGAGRVAEHDDGPVDRAVSGSFGDPCGFHRNGRGNGDRRSCGSFCEHGFASRGGGLRLFLDLGVARGLFLRMDLLGGVLLGLSCLSEGFALLGRRGACGLGRGHLRGGGGATGSGAGGGADGVRAAGGEPVA
jgi:hypothetical protein